MGFFTLSARQEYYSLPALPALALLAGGFLARADSARADSARAHQADPIASRAALRWSLFFSCP